MLFLAAMAVTGAPPFAIFVGELFILSALFAQYGWVLSVVVILFLAIAFIALNFRVGKMIFMKHGEIIKEKFHFETIVPMINLTLSLLVLFFIPYIEQLLKKFL